MRGASIPAAPLQAQGRLFAKNAKERGSQCVDDDSWIESPGHPPIFWFLSVI